MLVSTQDILSLEGISHRANTKLFSDIVEAFELIRNSDYKLTGRSRDKSLLAEAKVESIVKYHTGLSIRFRTGRDYGITAYVAPPHLDRNHPVLTDAHRNYYSNNDAKNRIRRAKGSIKGSIDLTTGRVSGVFSEIRSEIFVSAQMLQDDGLFTSEETAAAFLHEIGHLMAYYEYLGRHVIINHVMEDVHKEYTDTETDKQKVELLEVVKEGLELDDIDADVATSISKEETLKVLIVSELVKKRYSATNTDYYDLRTFEAMADQYVSRMGAARHVVTGLDKIHRYSGTTVSQSNTKYLITETFKVFNMLLFSPFVLLFMSLVDMPMDIYDPPKDRFNRLRRDLVSAMKDPKLDSDYRKRLKEDVEMIEKIINEIEERPSSFMFVWKLIRPSLRKQMNAAKMLQQLEELKDNELFVQANTLKSMDT